MGLVMQLFGTLIICLVCNCMSVMFTWPSSTYRLFESTNTTLHRPMTEGELSLFGSLLSAGALVGTPILGMGMDRLGRKRCSVIASSLAVVSWAMVAATSRVEVVLVAMFVSGLSGGAFLVVPIFVSEICQESIRGAMTTGTMISWATGILVSYLAGGLLSYEAMVYFCLTLNVVATACLCLLKESPTCLMVQGLENEAAKSIAFYRSTKPDSKEVLDEISAIRRSLRPDMHEIPENEKLNVQKPASKEMEKLSCFEFIKKSHSTRKALSMNIILVTVSIFQGQVVLQVYAEPLLAESIPSMSPTIGSVLMAVVAIVTGLGAAYLIEVAGRRPLMIYGSFTTGISCVLLGILLHLKCGPNWLIAANIYIYVCLYTLGAGTVPYVIVAEMFLPEVRSFASMLVIEWVWLCNYIILFVFNPLLKAIGLGPVFYIFAAVCALTGVYSIFMLPETKGLAIDEIQDKFCKKRTRKIKSFMGDKKTLDPCLS